MGTHLTFSIGMTELGWSHGSDLLLRTLYTPTGRALSGSYTGGIWGVRELFWACLQLGNKERGWQKDYSENIHTVEGCMCDVASHCYIHRPVSVPENHSLLPAFFCPFVWLPHLPTLLLPLLFHCCQWISPPASPSVSLFFPSLSSSSIPSSLPLPIFACATFNCSDMPCGKLCLCVLEQALLVMAVVPDVRGGV